MLRAKKPFPYIRVIITAVAFGLVGIVIWRSLAAPNPNLTGDLNNDNVVNGADLSILAANYKTSNSVADINKDGTVNSTDVSMLIHNYGRTYTAGGGGVGTGASHATCNGGSCSAIIFPTTGIPLTVANAASGPNPMYIYPGVPGGLACTTQAPCPVVFVYSDTCNSNSATKPATCFTTTNPDAGPAGWATTAATGKFIVVVIFANGAGFYSPVLYPGIGAGLDQGPELLAALQYMKSHYAIDNNRIFATGGSKGGDFTNETLCDPALEGNFAGIATLSAVFGTTANNKPPATLGTGTCPAMVRSGATSLPDPNPSAHPLMMQWIFAYNDNGNDGCAPSQGIPADGTVGGTWPNTNGACFNGGGVGSHGYGTAEPYVYSQDEQATEIANPAFGCSNATSTLSIGNGGVKVRTYGGCRSNNANTVEVQVIDVKASCHAYGCNNVGGLGNLSDHIWNFWTTGSKTP